MHTIKIKRSIRKAKLANPPATRRFLQFAQKFFANENHLEFAVEALLFGLLLAISVWPIVAAAGAISQLLLTATS